MRSRVDWSSVSKLNYQDFCKKYPTVDIPFDKWKGIVYEFNYSFRDYILETGERAKLPSGFGEFSITKKKRKKVKSAPNGKEYINLPIDWKRTKERGKRIYHFNYHTEGYSFKWMWFKDTARIKQTKLFYFKPTRVTSRLLAHYINTDPKYQNLYHQWTAK